MKTTAAGSGADRRKVLAPILLRLIPGDPYAALRIDGDRSVELRRRLGGHRHDRPKLASVERAQVNIVVAGRVAVPGNPGAAVRAERHHRLPIVARADRDA